MNFLPDERTGDFRMHCTKSSQIALRSHNVGNRCRLLVQNEADILREYSVNIATTRVHHSRNGLAREH